MAYREWRAAVGRVVVCLVGCFVFFLSCMFFSQPGKVLAQAPGTPPVSSPIPSKPDAKNADEGAIFDRILNRVRFENDGTEVSETEAVIRVQSQAGVEAFGQLVFGYSSATEKLEVEYVRVRKPDGTVVATPESTAQDFGPEVLREAPMYSDYRQRHISVAALAPGDVLEYRTVTRVLTPLAAGNFWYEYTFPKGIAVNEDRLELNLPKAREIKLKTPTRAPEIRETGDRRVYTWVVKDIQPDRDKNKDSDEEDTGPDVQLTTFTSWTQVAQWYAKLQGERMTVDDSVRKKADELTKGAATPTEKARRLYDFVALDIRYVSISLGIGRYQPHAAGDVLANGYGDCKDKHTLFSAMLKAEGIQSYPVLIDSSRKLDPDVPSPAQFDHVITAARLGPGTALTWLDTTPEVTPFGLILYQLRNKQAVLASDDSEGGLQRTPADSPIKSYLHFVLDGKFSEYGALDATLEVTAQGDRDWPLRANFRRVAAAQWKDFVKALSASWGLPGDVDDIHLDPVEDTSKPFHLKYHLHADGYFVVPAASVNFRPIPPLGLPAIHAAERSADPLNIGPAGEIDYRVRLQFPENYTVHTPIPVKMSRDYGDYSSAYSLSKGVLEGERKLVVKMNEIGALRRSDYESFRNAAHSDEDQLLSCTILAPSGQGERSGAAKMEGTPTELHRAGLKALQSKDYRTAIELLKRAAEGDADLASPGMKDGWYDLGLAYADANQHAEAIAAFRKQLQEDSQSKNANGELALELQQMGKNEEAIGAFRKQLEETPYDKATLKNLGLLLAQVGRDAEARTELEAAVAMPPDDPEIKMALAQVYGRLGEKALAQELMKSLTGSAAGDSGQDIFAAALRNDIDPTQTENDAEQVLYDIGGQFDSGEMDRLGPSAFSSMRLVALAWARTGWAKFQRGENLPAMQFLQSAWLLSESGTVANRLGQVLEKQGQREKARHIYALAVAAGGSDVADSRARLAKIAGDSVAAKEIAAAAAELVETRTLKLGTITGKSVSARFNLVFDSSPRPERAEFVDGDEGLRPAGEQLREKDFAVRFPDVSSVKIVRRGLVSCAAAGCSVELMPIEQVVAGAPAK